MKKFILACIAAAFFALPALSGCQDKSESEPDGHVSTNILAPR